jgi:hypothetical protein
MAMDIGLDVDSRVCMDVCLDVWLCFWMYGCVYGYVFVAMCSGMCMDTGSRSSARPGSINIGAYLSLGPVSSSLGLTPSRGPFE